MTERFLTQAQADALSEAIAAELDLVFRGSQETYGEIMGCVGRAIAEATVQPGDAGWCQGCERWVPKGVIAILSRLPEGEPMLFPEVPDSEMACGHKEHREGHCPKEACRV